MSLFHISQKSCNFATKTLIICIELDGGVHNDEKVKQKDEERTVFLKQNRIQVLRFRNEEVEQNIEYVLERIKDFILSINQGQEGVQAPNPLT